MKQRKMSLMCALLALVVATSACGNTGNPLSPKVDTTCQVEGAINIGGPLPCQFPPAAQPTSLSFVSSNPAANNKDAPLWATVVSGGGSTGVVTGDKLNVTMTYTISAEHWAEATAKGVGIGVNVCISEDGVKPVEASCATSQLPAGRAAGETTHALRLMRQHSQATQTKHLIAYVEWLPTGVNGIPFFTKVIDKIFYWKG